MTEINNDKQNQSAVNDGSSKPESPKPDNGVKGNEDHWIRFASPRPKAAKQKRKLFANFAESYIDLPTPLTPMRVTDAVLKRPGQIAHALVHGDGWNVNAFLMLIASFCILAYGLLMGSFSGGHQLWLSPVKLWLTVVLGALLCFPSLYIFICLSGGKQTIGQACGFLLVALTLGSILLLGFAPIVWVFSQSSETVVFMGFLHLLFGVVSAFFGLSLLRTIIEFMNKHSFNFLSYWGLMFLIVVFQMATFFRPIIAESDGFRIEGKRFFLAHWGYVLHSN